MTDVFTRLKELWDATTKGEWAAVHGPKQSRYSYVTSDSGTVLQRDHYGGRRQAATGSGSDADFIAYAHNSVPAMLAEVECLRIRVQYSFATENEKLREENTELKQRIEKLERALAVFFGRLQVITDSSLYDLERRRARSLIEQANQILEDGK